MVKTRAIPRAAINRVKGVIPDVFIEQLQRDKVIKIVENIQMQSDEDV